VYTVGIVTAVGDQVNDIKLGMRVGVGLQRWSLDDSRGYSGYAKAIRVDHRFVFPIPENLPTDRVATLLCAGVTVFSPLHRFGYGKGHKIGVGLSLR
jgi:D-arabinose 1-dehydrogenase-like Zn-dependent alcohol dehydrogenase